MAKNFNPSNGLPTFELQPGDPFAPFLNQVKPGIIPFWSSRKGGQFNLDKLGPGINLFSNALTGIWQDGSFTLAPGKLSRLNSPAKG